MTASAPVRARQRRATGRARAMALTFQKLFPVAARLTMMSPQLQFAPQRVPDPQRIPVPTRHGDMTALLYTPAAEDIDTRHRAGGRPPVHLLLHGGAFLVRHPEHEDNVARYVAGALGACVVVPDYDVRWCPLVGTPAPT